MHFADSVKFEEGSKRGPNEPKAFWHFAAIVVYANFAGFARGSFGDLLQFYVSRYGCCHQRLAVVRHIDREDKQSSTAADDSRGCSHAS